MIVVNIYFLLFYQRHFYAMKNKTCFTFSQTIPDLNESTSHNMKVTMVSWSSDDHHVFTAVTDFSIKIWNADTGELMQILKVRALCLGKQELIIQHCLITASSSRVKATLLVIFGICIYLIK